jgi:peptidoglycan hydrolase-like protein with peptidoglycan-binding domain
MKSVKFAAVAAIALGLMSTAAMAYTNQTPEAQAIEAGKTQAFKSSSPHNDPGAALSASFDADKAKQEHMQLMAINKLMYNKQKSQNVRMLQKDLNKKGFGVKVDGIYGQETSSAVSKFQATEKLRPTGLTNQSTLNKLGTPSSAQ